MRCNVSEMGVSEDRGPSIDPQIERFPYNKDPNNVPLVSETPKFSELFRTPSRQPGGSFCDFCVRRTKVDRDRRPRTCTCAGNVGFRVWGLGFRAYGLGFRVEGNHPRGARMHKACVGKEPRSAGPSLVSPPPVRSKV